MGRSAQVGGNGIAAEPDEGAQHIDNLQDDQAGSAQRTRWSTIGTPAARSPPHVERDISSQTIKATMIAVHLG